MICPTCGCSLVRLGISKDKATPYTYNDEEYHFCCQGCAEIFDTAPEKYLQELSELIVCSVCLAEKPKIVAVRREIAGEEVHFCRCPHCQDMFRNGPDYYKKQLAGSDAAKEADSAARVRAMVPQATLECIANNDWFHHWNHRCGRVTPQAVFEESQISGNGKSRGRCNLGWRCSGTFLYPQTSSRKS